ncbi:AAA-ATPase At3g50940-like isoform X2 [Trifolium pratense]|uniref:AAA-ATPase At3g50940-like isoform X2 n=1 Tax=Trifolium pratense TaxID=57577 RepID=UPI001E693C49|nr:AAA-ATPase At3g50940-like isoform X2 [Trifolium pratense]
MRSPSMNHFSSLFTTNIGSPTSWFTIYASFSSFMMILRTVINDLIPLRLRTFIISKLQSFFTNYQPNNHQVSLQIYQLWDGTPNNLFHAAKEYLPTKISNTYKSLKVGKLFNQNNILVAFDGKQPVVDEFEGIKIKWLLVEKTKNRPSGNTKSELDEIYDGEMYVYQNMPREYEGNGFVLSFDEKHRDKVMEKYLPHVLSTYETIKAEQRILKIHSGGGGGWRSSNFNHPASFDSLALDPDLRKTITDDLDRFLRRKKIYKKVGKPWKRGYLLYGPPGTGKSSLIVAIAKYLKFDVYDLDLSSVMSNSVLTTVLRATSNRSIIVIEDIDCNKEVLDRSKSAADMNPDMDPVGSFLGVKMAMGGRGRSDNSGKFTLSGLLNYMDGLWACCGEERILIFTTNHKDKIDPALLRPGRMDMHIELSYLKAKAFRILASNYLDIEEHHHPFLEQVDELLDKMDVTPALVAEHLLRGEDADVALKTLIKLLQGMDISRGNE